jgi:6-pyruvoyl-tetrahydropterin synthase
VSDLPAQYPVEGLTGVGWTFSASHRDPIRQELHGHSYEVTAWFDHKPARDALVLQEHLKNALTAFDHKTLPDEMTRGETLAAAIMHITDAVGVELRRPLERLYAKVGRCG